MKRILTASAALAVTATELFAGGIDRSGQSVTVIFEEGDYAELSFGHVSPDVSGVQVIPIGPFGVGSASGDMTESYLQFSAAYKQSFANGFDAAIIFDQPFGADVDYPDDRGYFAAGSMAEVNSKALSGILKYRFASNISIFGGLRVQTIEAQAAIPSVAGYSADGDRDTGVGYIVGVGYQMPDIALRVALTYNSSVKHEVETDESSAVMAGTSITHVETPESINLEFETGVAADTLLFGSVRWANWSEFDVAPAIYRELTRSPGSPGGEALVSYEDDSVTYTLGLGRRFGENWAGLVSVGYEPRNDTFSANLGPTDGSVSLGVGATYTTGRVSVSGGARYLWIGDTRTRVSGVEATDFQDNTAVALGLELGYHF